MDVNKPCDYDFGSPLVQDGYAVGILSQQIGCQSFPFESSIYTRLASYFAWIRQEASTQPGSCFRATTTTLTSTPLSTTTTIDMTTSTTTAAPFVCPEQNGFFPLDPSIFFKEVYELLQTNNNT